MPERLHNGANEAIELSKIVEGEYLEFHNFD